MSAFHNNMLLGSAKTADLGDPIEQSLRFSGLQYLEGSTYPSGADFTVSMWFKYNASNGNSPCLFGSVYYGWGIGLVQDQFGGISSSWHYSDKYLRDPSAWYHLVYSNNGIWLNGEQVSVPNWPGFGTTLSAYNFLIGDVYKVTGDHQYKWTGYIADAYLVDGSNLAPTTFGRYNADGVWVPKDPELTNSARVSDTGTSTLYSQDNIFTPWVASSNHFYYVVNGDLIIDFPDGNADVTNIKFNGGANTGGVDWELFVNGTSAGTGTTSSGYGPQNSVDIASTNVTQVRLTSSGGNGDVGMGGLEFNDVQVTRTNDYGANGFHLTFADPSDVGKDYSGNGNDFTATGFDTTSYVNGWWVDDVTNAVAGNVPNSQGQPYFIDMVPADGNLTFGEAGGADNMQELFDGSLTSYVYWVGKEHLNSGDITSGTFDLRDYVGSLTSVEVYAWAQYTNLVPYQLDLLDSSKNVIAGSNVVIDNTVLTWLETPIPAGSDPRYLRISVTADAVGQRTYLYAIRINGQILSQSEQTSPDYDLMQDSPTQNFATMNPLDPFSDTLSDANLALSVASSQHAAPGTMALVENKYYIELTCDNPPTNSPTNRQYALFLVPTSGITNANPVLSSGAYEIKVYSGTTFAVVTNNSVVLSGTLPSIPAAGFVIQVLYNANTRQLYACVDNTNWLRNNGSIASTFDAAQPTLVLAAPTSGHYTAGVTNYNGTGNINYGQQPYLHTPPTDFKALQTANLDEPTIKDPSEHFRAIAAGPATTVGTGELGGNWSAYLTPAIGSWLASAGYDATGGFTGNVGGGGVSAVPNGTGPGTTGSLMTFAPDTDVAFTTLEVYMPNAGQNAKFDGTVTAVTNSSWTQVATNGTINKTTPLEMYANAGVYAYCQGIRINGNQILVDSGPLAAAQAAFPDGLWWIKDMVNANNHQLVTSVLGTGSVLRLNNGSSNSGGGMATSYVPPTGDSVAWCWNYDAANPANNGFQFLQYTGVNPDGASIYNVPHDLGKPVDMFLITKAVGPNPVWTWMSGGGTTNGRFELPYNINGSTIAAYFDVPTATHIPVGTSDWLNENGTLYNCWAWCAIPGYSAFGSYTGNSSADGPFIYTGFKPAFVMVKGTPAGYNWAIFDSTRSPYNPSTARLIPNSTVDEQNDYPIDLLSNGFKIRNTAGSAGGAAVNYIYAAFAENPFGGENTAPATAR